MAVALSGGADSVALACVLFDLDRREEIVLAGFAHLNHGLRGEEADRDEAFCRAFAERLSRPIVVESTDVAQLARAERRSIEDTARRARYAFLERAADVLAADDMAVAHTRNDQAETVLLRLFRGAGPDGLAAVHSRRGRFVRPLLDVSRPQILEYLQELKVEFREDASNRDVSIPRNRVRHELLPLLEQRFSPEIVTRLARAAAMAADDARFFRELVDARAASLLVLEPGRVTIDRRALATESPALASRLILRALRHVAGERFVGFDQIDRVLTVASDGPESADFPGGRVERIGDRVVLTCRALSHAALGPEWNNFHYTLSIPGEVFVAEAGCAIEARRVPVATGASAGETLGLAGQRDATVIDAAGLPDILSVRGRRRGDTFRPLGSPGHKKLQDLFVDRKVPRGSRDRVPIVVDGRDRIIWVAGHAVAEEFRVTDRTQSMVVLRLRDLGGRS